MLEKLSKAGKLGVNINGDLPEEKLGERSKRFKTKIIWIGDNPLFLDPFEVARIVAENSEGLVGFGVLTPRWRVEEIYKRIRELEKDYGDRFILGVATGRAKLDEFEKFLKKLKEKFDEFLCGVTWLKSYEVAKKYCSGLLLNHVHPKHLKAFEEFDGFKAAYGPALILPSRFYQDLVIAAAVVMRSSKSFLKTFGYYTIYEKIRSVKIEDLIVKRQRGIDLERDRNYMKLKEGVEEIIDFFTISGSAEKITLRIKELLKLCDHVVLGDPFFRDEGSPEAFNLLLSRLDLS